MVLKIEALFENGVFVPARRPGLADRERVQLTVELGSLPTGASRENTAQRARTDGNPVIALDYHPDGC